MPWGFLYEEEALIMAHAHARPEILAPAGTPVAFQAALKAGADAVYLGLDEFNMRAMAKNFAMTDLPARCAEAHAAGVKLYVACNTLIYEHELPQLEQMLDACRAAEVDAVIGWDIAVLEAARARGIEVHLSTQTSVANSRALLHLHRTFGAHRFVLARECTLDDIKAMRTAIKQELGEGAARIELEAFAHGAMCVAVSGRCFMSQFQYGKSASRGECLQPCRRAYTVHNEEEDQAFVVRDHHVMSPHDLCTLPFVEQLYEAGIHCFKIEGRSRSPEYVAAAVVAYREVLQMWHAHAQGEEDGGPDFAARYQALKDHHMTRLAEVYNRGFSDGFYMGQPMGDWSVTSNSQATTRKAFVGRVVNYYRKPGVAEVQVVSTPFDRGERLLFLGSTTGVLEQVAESMQIEHTPVERAAQGVLVAIKTNEPVRRGDELYVVRPVDEPEMNHE
jgi:putative protease